MKVLVALLFVYTIFTPFVAGANEPYWKFGNEQLKQTLNYIISRLWSNGVIKDTYTTWFGLTCIYQPPCFDSKTFIPFNETVGTLRHVLETGTLRLGSDIKKPIIFYDNGGQLSGSEYDLSLAIAREMSLMYGLNITVQWKIINSTTSFFPNVTTPMTQNNDYDAVLSYMSSNPERNKTVSFTCPYSPQSVVTIIRGGAEPGRNFTRLADFNYPFVLLGIRTGTVYETYKQQYIHDAYTYPLNPSADRGYSNLPTLHGIIDDIQPILYYILQNQNPNYFSSPLWDFPEAAPFFGIATRKDVVVVSNPPSPQQQESVSTSVDGTSSKAAVIVGTILGILIALLVVALVIVLRYRNRVPNNSFQRQMSEVDTYRILGPLGKDSGLYLLRQAEQFYIGKVVTKEAAKDAGRDLRDLSHENVLAYYSTWQNEQYDYILYHPFESDTLLQNITSRDISPERILKILRQIAKGLRYLETKNVVHKHLSLSSILITNTDEIKIVYAVQIKDINGPEVAPEAQRDGIYGPKSDVFSFGVIMLRMYSKGADPFKENPQKLDVLVQSPPKCPSDIFQLIQCCISSKIDVRPTLAKIEEALK